MKLKKEYDFYSFNSSKEYAEFIIKCIYDGSINKISLCGYIEDHSLKKLRCFTTYKNSTELKEAIKNIDPLFVIKCNYINNKKK